MVGKRQFFCLSTDNVEIFAGLMAYFLPGNRILDARNNK